MDFTDILLANNLFIVAAIDAKEAEQVDSGYRSDDGKELERNGSSNAADDEEELNKYMNTQLADGIVSSCQLDRYFL